MSGQTLCIRTFAEAIRKKMKKASVIKDFGTDTTATQNGSLVRVFYPLLLTAVIYEARAIDETGWPDLSATMSTELKNGNSEIHPKVKELAEDAAIKSTVIAYFDVNITPNIIPTALSIVLDAVETIIKNDNLLGPKKIKALVEKRKRVSDSEYLAEVFLLAITVGTNKVPPEPTQKKTTDETRLDLLSPPDEIAPIEVPYVRKCMEAYGDANNMEEFSEELLVNFPAQKRHFTRQRQDFYIAESVRRDTRDVYGDSDPDRFEALKSDVHSGIVDKYEEDYVDGFQRMNAVLQKATETSVGTTWLSQRYEGRINNAKKGVCHVLANDDTIKSWVDPDE